MKSTKNTSLTKLIPVMICFFAMGFVDLVGIASNYVKADLGLTDSQANIFPSLVFFWFLIFSVPTGMLMNRIGRKRTVLFSLVITFFSLLLPVFGDSYALMLISFSLLGIGNALMQTSLNPLLSTIVSKHKLASSLTFGQFVKAIASFLAPYIAMWGATAILPSFGLSWRILFPVYALISVVAVVWLNATSIKEEIEKGTPSTFIQCLALLGKPFILLSFIGIMCHAFVEMHSGHISVNSDRKGTTFYVTFPIQHIALQTPIASVTLPDESIPYSVLEQEALDDDKIPSSDLPSILIIDDNPDIRQYVKMLLTTEYNVLEAQDANKGIRLAMKYVPDVIVSDVMMPGMDGIECCRHLKSEVQTCHIPVILLTACSLDEQRMAKLPEYLYFHSFTDIV